MTIFWDSQSELVKGVRFTFFRHLPITKVLVIMNFARQRYLANQRILWDIMHLRKAETQ